MNQDKLLKKPNTFPFEPSESFLPTMQNFSPSLPSTSLEFSLPQTHHGKTEISVPKGFSGTDKTSDIHQRGVFKSIAVSIKDPIDIYWDDLPNFVNRFIPHKQSKCSNCMPAFAQHYLSIQYFT